MDGAGAMSLFKDIHSGLKIVGFVEDISENVSPRVSISGHLDRILRGQPNLLSKRYFVGNTRKRANKTGPGEVGVNV